MKRHWKDVSFRGRGIDYDNGFGRWGWMYRENRRASPDPEQTKRIEKGWPDWKNWRKNWECRESIGKIYIVHWKIIIK